MKKILPLALLFVLVGCAVSPEMIPDSTGDSAMLLKIKNDIEKGKELQTGYAWILWYLPVLFLVLAWGYKEFFGKKGKCPCPEEEEISKEPEPTKEPEPVTPVEEPVVEEPVVAAEQPVATETPEVINNTTTENQQ